MIKMEIPFEKIDGDYIQRCLNSHLDPETGSPYWLEKAEEYGGVEKAKADIETWSDLKEVFGLSTAEGKEEFSEALRHRPYTDFLPRDSVSDIYIIGESGSTMGDPKRAPITEEDRDEIIEMTNDWLDEQGFPRNEDWMWIGPPFPPHTIGTYPQEFADSREGNIFGVDLDPRIMKKYGQEGMDKALKRYKQHIGEQAESVFKNQDIGVLWTTSKILEQLPKDTDVSKLGLDAVFHAGTPLSRETYRQFVEETYEDMEFAGGFGTAVTEWTGFQVPDRENYDVIYVPAQPTRNMEVVDEEGKPVDYGERGFLTTSKVTEDFLMPALLEEVKATKVEPPENLEGVDWPCVKDIKSTKSREEKEKGGAY